MKTSKVQLHELVGLLKDINVDSVEAQHQALKNLKRITPEELI